MSKRRKIDIFPKGITHAFGPKKRVLQKVEKLTFFQRGLDQKWPFFQIFFLGNIGHKNDFYDILERKNAFITYKNKNFKKSKNQNFYKQVNPWFCSKNGHFSNFPFKAI